jgi:antitoxin (DNA-binding transcriptional repressor) of toxin-antitoxin stability system
MQISKAYFKSHALELFRQVESTGESMIVTDHGKPAVEIRPYRSPDRHPLEVLRGTVKRFENPFDPVGEDDWDALS